MCACRACYGVLRFIMESGAKGCEVIVSGKLRAQRAKAMKFKDGYMVSSGNPTRDYIDGAIRHVLLRQGVLGIKVTPCSTTAGQPHTRSKNLQYAPPFFHSRSWCVALQAAPGHGLYRPRACACLLHLRPGVLVQLCRLSH